LITAATYDRVLGMSTSAMKASARALAERQGRDLPAARRLRFWLALRSLERFAAGRPLEVLDAGCGEGLLAEALARRHPDWRIVGGDLDAARLELGRQRLGDLANVRFVEVDLTGDLGDAAYDAVLAIECLVEIPEDDAALAAMARALRPGGLLVAHVPQRDWRPLLRGSEATWRHEVRHGYSAEELRAKLAANGLEVTSLQPTSRALVRLAQELRDRNRHRNLKFQLLMFPVSAAAAGLERLGLRVGRSRALHAEAVRRA
jgi:ubiquinone/menaquinone biosynthesis C-methylase UbiE